MEESTLMYGLATNIKISSNQYNCILATSNAAKTTNHIVTVKVIYVNMT